MTGRAITNGTTLLTYPLSYDGLDHLVRWNDTQTTSNEEWYMYDGAGQRVLRRSQTGTGTSNTKYTVYAFGVQDDVYDGSGASYSDKYYYSLAGRLLGELNGGKTKFLLTDALGSVVASISNTVSSAAVLGNQVYGPYGNNPYSKGTITTPKGYTGQYNDALTQLDYYNARYYDPVVGVFLSADIVQGNPQGMNPYTYVNGNPETYSDPTGNAPTRPNGPPPLIIAACVIDIVACVAGASVIFLTWVIVAAPERQIGPTPPNQPQPAPTPTPPPGCCALSVAFQGSGTGGTLSVQPHSSPPQTQTGSSGGGLIPPIPVSAPGAPCSFTSDTPVKTQQGEKAIGKLHVGDKVLAYNPKTHKMEQEPILHVWINHDNDLVDLTITTTKGPGGKVTKTSEVIHTNKKHPFFTLEHGFLPVGQITLGMHILRADGRVGVVTGWKVVPGSEVMYNLEVAQDHTFTVGDGQWVVHNRCDPQDYTDLRNSLRQAGRVPQNVDTQAHHLVPCGYQQDPLVAKAIAGGFGFNSAANGIALPRNMAGSNQLDLPYHLGNHPAYNAEIGQQIAEEIRSLEQQFGSLQNVPDSIAAEVMQGIANDARYAIESAGGGGVCINDIF